MQIIQVVPEAGLGPELLCPKLLGWDEGKKYFTGETNVGRVHKTLLHFLSCLPRWGNFLEPSLDPPHWGAGGPVREVGSEAVPAAKREREQRGSGEGEGEYL